MKIITYNLNWGITSITLNIIVNKDIKDGWQPFNSPFSVTEYDGELRFYQAMVKYEP